MKVLYVQHKKLRYRVPEVMQKMKKEGLSRFIKKRKVAILWGYAKYVFIKRKIDLVHSDVFVPMQTITPRGKRHCWKLERMLADGIQVRSVKME